MAKYMGGGVLIMDGFNKELKAFIDFLAEKCDFKFDLDSFDHRLMLQKYVYIAQFFGWEHNYDYNLYIRGPYSKTLAHDYYKPDDGDMLPVQEVNLGFQEENFASLIKGKDVPWLEMSATLLLVHESYKDFYEGENLEFQVKDRAQELKSSISPKVTEGAFNDLKKYEILNTLHSHL